MVAKALRVAVIGGTGVVGHTIARVLESRGFPVRDLLPVASERSRGSEVEGFGRRWPVHDLSGFDFRGIDLCFFTAGAAVSRNMVPRALDAGCRVVDNTTAFRMVSDVPLVVPEINGARIDAATRLAACPNCTTINLVMALAPVLAVSDLRRVVVTSFQSVSGAGRDALDEMDAQIDADRRGLSLEPRVLPGIIAYNCLPQIGEVGASGYTTEEEKIIEETRKILDRAVLPVMPTAVRVPVRVGHALSVYVEATDEIDAPSVIEAWKRHDGVDYSDGIPTPLDIADQDAVVVGRLRLDPSSPHMASFWVVGDNLRKGAATNSVQIAERMVTA